MTDPAAPVTAPAPAASAPAGPPPSPNDNLILLCGKSATGKSAALRNIKDPEGVFYLNCEAGKKLPFASKFKKHVVTEPHQVHEAFAFAETQPQLHTIVVDSITFLMDMYNTQYIHGLADGRAAWGDYAQFFRRLMQQHVAKSTKNVIMIAHTKSDLNEAEMVTEVAVPIQGQLKGHGVEAFFTQVVAAKKVPVKDIDTTRTPLLTLNEEENDMGIKYVLQTRLNKATVNERLRAPMGMWTVAETFVDNDMQIVLDRIHDYYAD